MLEKENALQAAMQYLQAMEPNFSKMKETAVFKFKSLDRWSKTVLVTLLLWRIYCLLPKGTVTTIHLEFSTPDDLELLLAKLPTTTYPSQVILLSKHPSLDISTPIRINDHHANRHFIFRHASTHNPVHLRCTGSTPALTIRSNNVEISNLFIEGCSRSAIIVDTPSSFNPSSSGNTTSLSNLTLANNRADRGAAIFVAHGFVILSGVNATLNYASIGGAIYLAKGRTGLRVSPPASAQNSGPLVANTFTRNSANKGGVVYAEGALLGIQLREGDFEGNQAFHAGGVMYSTQLGAAAASIVNVDNCTFQGNQAGQVGGVLACEGNHEVTVTASLVKQNAAGGRGGALWVHSPFFGKLDIQSTTFKSNAAGCPAAAALVSSSDSKTSTTSSTPSSATKPSTSKPSSTMPSSRRRAALRANSTAPAVAAPAPSPSSRPSSSAAPDAKSSMGGAVHVTGSVRITIADKTKLISNTAVFAGGAISCADCASVNLTDAGFTDNAAASGGAVYLQLLKGPATISASSFIGNRAAQAKSGQTKPVNGTKATGGSGAVAKGVCGRNGGGAVCMELAQGSAATVDSSVFEENIAYSGGAVYTNLDTCTRRGDNCTVDVSTSTFHANSAKHSGGALHFTDMTGVNLNCHPRLLTARNTTRTMPVANTTAPEIKPDNSTSSEIIAAAKSPEANSTKSTDAKSGTLAAAPASTADSSKSSASKATGSKGDLAPIKPSRAGVPKVQRPAPKPNKRPSTPPSTAPSAVSTSPNSVAAIKPAPRRRAPAPSSPSPAPQATPPVKPTPHPTSAFKSAPASPGSNTTRPHTPPPLVCSRQLKPLHAATPSSSERNRCSNTFTANTVSSGYGPHVSSRVYCLEPSRLPTVHTPLPNALAPSSTLSRVRVANDQTFSYTVAPFDYFLQHVNVSVPDVSIGSEAKASAIQVSSPQVPIHFGEALLPNVSVSGDIGTHSIVIQARLGSRIIASTAVTVDVRTCEVGEITSGRTCQSCDHAKGWTFSFDPTKTKCERCPWNAFCRGWAIIPRDGYWQAHPRSSRVHTCMLPGACKYQGRASALAALQDGYQQYQDVPAKNSTQYQDMLCTRGYEGPMCGSCSAGYGRSGEKCEKCKSRIATFVSMLTWRLLEAALVAVLVAIRIYSGHEFTRKVQKRSGDALEVQPEQPRGGRLTLLHAKSFHKYFLKGDTSSTIKLLGEGRYGVGAVAESLILCWQLIRLVASIPLAVPPTVSSFLSIFTPSALHVPLDCLLGPDSTHKAVTRITLSVLTPGVVAATLLVAWVIFLCKRKIPTSQLPHLMLEATVLTFFELSIFYYPQVISSLLSTFSCHSLASPLSLLLRRPFSPTSPSHPFFGYWAQDTSITCYSSAHLSFALPTALPLLLTLGALPPTLIYLFLSHQAASKALPSNKLYTRYGYLFTDFTRPYTFGHTMKFLFLLAACALTQGPIQYLGPFLQVTAFTALTVFASYWLLVNHPFSWSAMNLFTVAAIAPAMLTSATSMLLMFLPTTGLMVHVAAALWLPAMLVDGLVMGLLAGLVTVVVKPLLPVKRMQAVGVKLQEVVKGKQWRAAADAAAEKKLK